jgi:hypothetical protein
MAIGRKLETLNIDDYSGGCNYDRDLTSLEENESPNSINVIFDDTVIRKRLGYKEIVDSSSGEPGYCLFDYGVAGVGRRLVSHIGDTVYTLSNLQGSLSSIRTGTTQAISYMAEVKQLLIHTFSDYSSPYYWNGTDASMALLSASAPGFKHAIETQGYLLGANISGEPLRIYYEDINTMVGGSFASYFTLTGEKDDEITGWFIINGRTYASTKTGIFRISYIGGVAVFEYKQVISEVGAIPRTAQTVISNEFGQVVIFLGYDLNLYLFDGSFIRVISQKYRVANNETPIAPSYVEWNKLDNSNSTYDPVSQVYSVYVTAKGDTTNYYSFNIDIRNLAYFPFDNMTFHSTTVAEDRIGRKFRVGADYGGKIHKMFANYNNDNGLVIVEHYESPILMQKPAARSKTASLDLYFKPVARYEVIMEDRTDFDKTWKPRTTLKMYGSRDRFLGNNTMLGTTAVLGSEKEIVMYKPNVPVTGNTYRYRIRTCSSSEAGSYVQYWTGTVAGTGGTTSITGTNTVWQSYMTSANGWKIHIEDGNHANTTYDFDYVSATSATVSTMAAGNFSGATYELYKTECAAAGPAWELVKVDFLSQALGAGKSEPQR